MPCPTSLTCSRADVPAVRPPPADGPADGARRTQVPAPREGTVIVPTPGDALGSSGFPARYARLPRDRAARPAQTSAYAVTGTAASVPAAAPATAGRRRYTAQVTTKHTA